MSDIILVPTHLDYAEQWHQWRSEKNSLKYNPILPVSVEELRARMVNMSSDLSNLKLASEFQFFVEIAGELVGSVNLKNISHMMNYGEIGYGISEKHQGKGIGTKAIRAFIHKLFSETDLRRVFAYVAEENMASRKLLERVGFIQEGICREHFIIQGKPTNEVLYGLLKAEWYGKAQK